MIKSMTGYGRYEETTDERKIIVEMKAVNHRYLDLGIRMPRKFNAFEADIRMILKEYVQRGKVDIGIICEEYKDQAFELKYNKTLAEKYIRYYRQMEEDFQIPYNISVAHLSKSPEVLSMEEIPLNEEEVWTLLKKCLTECAKKFVSFKEKEGERLYNDIVLKLDGMLSKVEDIEKRSPERIEEYRKKLEKKVKEFLENGILDDSRIAAEVLIYADRVCVDEETVRLRSHITEMKNSFHSKDSIGRKLDFLAQEMNREANTILSKSNDIEISNIAIDLKAEIEKIREQIQNIE